MDLSLLATGTVVTFVLILIRVSGMLVSSPFFSVTGIPQQTKVGIAVTLSILLFPLYASVGGYEVPTDLIQFTVLAVQEFIIGLLIGFAAELLFTGIRMAGEYLSVQMGMSIASILDPISGSQVPVIGQLYFIFAFLLFLSLNIHHGLIVAVDKSFHWIPLGQGIGKTGLLAERFVALSADMFTVALLVGIPVTGILLAVEIALSFVAKVMPQMNIFIVGLPLKAGIGLLLLMVSLPFLVPFLSDQYADLIRHLLGLYRGI